MAATARPLNMETPLPERGAGFRETISNALIITRREVRDSFRDWRIISPIILLTFFFPFIAQFVAGQFANFVSGYGAQIVGERTIPFLLMIVGFFPISISLVIALETFVGEKERRSLEPLLSTPLTNTELYIGKTLAAMIPPLLSSLGGHGGLSGQSGIWLSGVAAPSHADCADHRPDGGASSGDGHGRSGGIQSDDQHPRG